MNWRRLWLILASTALLFDVLLCAMVSISRNQFSWPLLFLGLTTRIAGALIIGALTGWLSARMGRSLRASFLGLLVCDLTWIKVMTGMGNPNAQDLLANPAIVMLVLICPAASANRPQVFWAGLTIAVLGPLCIAIWCLLSIRENASPDVRGAGLAQAVTVILAGAAMISGVIGIVVLRYTIESIERCMAPSTPNKVSPKNQPQG